jgi:hypothetical protein
VGSQGQVRDHLLVATAFKRLSDSSSALGRRSTKTHENSSRSVHWMTPSRTRTLP